MSTTRIQLALNVENVAEATRFYERLFGVPAHKQREGYANFAIADPPLKLVLIENPGAAGALNHIGVEASTTADVTAALHRFQAAGLHATVTAPYVPYGWWEFYAVTDDNPAGPEGGSTSVCAGSRSCG
jgi:catechol 2,3-dioxygenase-like lactoylglutathione lyase family enzyme